MQPLRTYPCQKNLTYVLSPALWLALETDQGLQKWPSETVVLEGNSAEAWQNKEFPDEEKAPF